MKQVHGGNTYEFYDSYGFEPLDFSANLNPYGMPKEIKNAIINSIDKYDVYPDIYCSELRRCISQYDNIPYENIICGNGAADLIFRCCLAKKPKKALVISPTFSEYENAIKAVGSEILYYNLNKEQSFKVCDDILHKIDSTVDMVFLCQPNNPTGHCISENLLLEILKKCTKENILLFCDECFLDFTLNEDSHSLKKYVSQYENIFILKSFTKLFSMAGLRLGYGISSDLKLLKAIENSGQAWSVSSVAITAGVEALKCKEYKAVSLKKINEEKTFLLCELKKLKIIALGYEANYIFFYCDNFSLYDELQKKGILIRQCQNYRNLDDGYYRIAVRTHNENKQLICALGEILKERGGTWER